MAKVYTIGFDGSVEEGTTVEWFEGFPVVSVGSINYTLSFFDYALVEGAEVGDLITDVEVRREGVWRLKSVETADDDKFVLVLRGSFYEGAISGFCKSVGLMVDGRIHLEPYFPEQVLARGLLGDGFEYTIQYIVLANRGDVFTHFTHNKQENRIFGVVYEVNDVPHIVTKFDEKMEV